MLTILSKYELRKTLAFAAAPVNRGAHLALRQVAESVHRHQLERTGNLQELLDRVPLVGQLHRSADELNAHLEFAHREPDVFHRRAHTELAVKAAELARNVLGLVQHHPEQKRASGHQLAAILAQTLGHAQ